MAVNVDALANRHAIDPNIYGVAFGDSGLLLDLRATLNRWGGNRTSRYHWQLNTSNTAADYFFENIVDDPGLNADNFIAQTFAGGAAPVMTVPMLPWLPKDRVNKRCGFSVQKYGQQKGIDPYALDCGSGFRLDDSKVTGNDPTDTSVAVGTQLQEAWIQHLRTTFKPAAEGGVRFYSLDNEPQLWNYSHFDVHPLPVSYDEQWERSRDYAAMIRAAEPGAIITGPDEWGWSGYFDSMLDYENDNTADRDSHGGLPLTDWILQQFRNYEQVNATRLLNVLAVHFYPQGGEFGSDNNVSPEMQALRNRSTRALWDPAYVNESWIGSSGVEGGIVRLIPRLKEWVANNYPGTKIGITEYNWGAENHINGATTQADILGILGRENVDVAVRWVAPPSGSPVYNAFKLFRNYNGTGSGFGDISVSAGGTNPDQLSAFAAIRSSDASMTIVLINKIAGDTPATVNLMNFTPLSGGSVQRWQLDAANVITRLSDSAVPGSSLSITLPGPSITLLIVPAGTVASKRSDFDGDGKADVVLRDATGSIGMWRMNGAVIVSGDFVGSPGGSYTIAGVGDFNGNGRADILLRDSLGNLGMWLMNGAAISSGAFVGAPGSYTVAGVADFDGDGRADILLRDSLGDLGMWIMNGPTITTGSLVGTPGSGYSVAGVADFSGDGRADILLRDSAGNLGMWTMNGSTITSGAFVGSPGSGYSVEGAADFGGDGKADILLRNGAGTIQVWTMNGTSVTSVATVGTAAGYSVSAANDYSGDGKADILLRDSSGNVGMWIMNGTVISTGAFVGSPRTSYVLY